MELKTVEDVIKTLDEIGPSLSRPLYDHEVKAMVYALAHEVKDLKSAAVTNRLLIEHEEAVRTTRAKRIPAKKNIAPVFKRGDIVVRVKDQKVNKTRGTVVKQNGDRTRVTFADVTQWVESRSLVYFTNHVTLHS